MKITAIISKCLFVLLLFVFISGNYSALQAQFKTETKEAAEKKHPEYIDTWKSGYFQGSTGGAWTSSVLVNNFLQESYKGQWIAGVKFNYEEGTHEFEHIGELLNMIHMRTNHK